MKQIAVGTCLFVSDSVLDQYITQRMCDKSGFEDKFILKSLIILLISFIFSFELNNMNTFSVLTVPCRDIFLSNKSEIVEVALVPNFGKTPSTKQTAKSISIFCLN